MNAEQTQALEALLTTFGWKRSSIQPGRWEHPLYPSWLFTTTNALLKVVAQVEP